MAITAEMTTSVMELYTAYFNRAADKAGVDYWLGEMDTKAWTIDQVAQSFAQQTEYTAIYAGLTNAQIVAQVYTNVLNKDAYTEDAEGAAYWEGRLNDTESPIPVNQFIQAVVNAATEEVGGVAVNATDKAIMDNKSAVSQYHYDLGLNITNTLLSSITADSATLDAAKLQADGMENPTIQPTTPTVPTFAFTDEWINGKTLYNVFDDDQNGSYESIVEFSFNNGQVIAEDYEGTYSIDENGILAVDFNDEDGINYIKGTQELTEPDAIELSWSGDYESVTNAQDGSEYFFFDLTEAQSFSSYTIAALDTTPPELVSASVVDGEYGVALDADIVLTFSEAVGFSQNSSYVMGIWYADGSSYGDSTISIDGNSVTIHPVAGFSANTDYMVYAQSDVLVDAAGNQFVGIAPGALDFSTTLL